MTDDEETTNLWTEFANDHRSYIDQPGGPFKPVRRKPTEFDADIEEMQAIDGTAPKTEPRNTPTLDELVAMFGVRGGD